MSLKIKVTFEDVLKSADKMKSNFKMKGFRKGQAHPLLVLFNEQHQSIQNAVLFKLGEMQLSYEQRVAILLGYFNYIYQYDNEKGEWDVSVSFQEMPSQLSEQIQQETNENQQEEHINQE